MADDITPLEEITNEAEKLRKDLGLKGNDEKEPSTPDQPQDNPNDEPSQPEENDYDDAYESGGVSSAYGLDPMSRPDKAGKAPSNSGGSKAPDRKDLSYKPDSSSDFLQACYNEIIMRAYAGTINVVTDKMVLDLADWILFAPFSFSAEKPADPKKEKTIYNHADEIMAENNQKGQYLAINFLELHKEIMDNIEKQKNGETPTWNKWQQEPECFANLVNVRAKAEADPNSPEAKVWNSFVNLPEKTLSTLSNQTTMLNFAIHHQAITMDMSDVDPLPVELTKSFKNMEKCFENPNLDIPTLKSNLNTEINTARQYVATDTPVNTEIREKLNQLSQLLLDPNATKENIAQKVVELENVHPIKHKMKEKAMEMYKKMKQNMNKISQAYASDPNKAKEEMDKYLQKIRETQEKAKATKDRYDDASWLWKRISVDFTVFKKRFQYGQTKADVKHTTTVAENTIQESPVSNQGAQNPKKDLESVENLKAFINYMGNKR